MQLKYCKINVKIYIILNNFKLFFNFKNKLFAKFKVLKYNKENNTTLVEINLKTGRHHQIRVQFASRGYPLCGDQRYGKKDGTQIALYAYKLQLNHPITKEAMTFEKAAEIYTRKEALEEELDKTYELWNDCTEQLKEIL